MLVLIVTGYCCEICLAGLAIAQVNKPVTLANLRWSLALGSFGVTQSVSFAIFSFKYFEAAKTITFAQNGVPYREQQRYLKQVRFIREVLIVNLSLAWVMMNYFFYKS